MRRRWGKGVGGRSLGGEAERAGPDPAHLPVTPAPQGLSAVGGPPRRSCRSSLCLTPLFPPLFWSLSVGGGQTLGALPPAVQPPATTGVLRVLLLHAGDRALPSPWRRRLLRFPHSAQPLGGEQPRAGAPPAPRAPGRRQPQTHALGAPHLAVTAAAGVGPLHPQDLGWAPPLLEGAGGGGGEQAETVVPSQDAIITHSYTLTLPVMQYSPYNVGPRYCNPPPLTPSINSLCLVPAKWCREGWGCWCSFWDRTGALGWSHQWVQSPVETKVSGRGVLGHSQAGTALILFNL